MSFITQAQRNPVPFIQGLTPIWVSPFVIRVGAGSCTDINNNIELIYPEYVEVNLLGKGVNGVDIGSYSENSVYALYAIGDDKGQVPPAYTLSLYSNGSIPVPSNIPSLPHGYTTYRARAYFRVGIGGAGFNKFTFDGQGTSYTLSYVTPVSFWISIVSGDTLFHEQEVSHIVPALTCTANIVYSFISPIPNHSLNFAMNGGFDPYFAATSQVAAVPMTGSLNIGLSRGTSFGFKYQFSATGDNAYGAISQYTIHL